MLAGFETAFLNFPFRTYFGVVKEPIQALLQRIIDSGCHVGELYMQFSLREEAFKFFCVPKENFFLPI
jgi:hypothetical protein